MLRAILNKSWQQHPTRHQVYGHLPPIRKTIQVRRTRHAGHCWRSRDEHISVVLRWTPTYGRAKAGRPARIYIQQLCEDTGCSPEQLPEAVKDREKWRGMDRDIQASNTTWWRWWWCIQPPCLFGQKMKIWSNSERGLAGSNSEFSFSSTCCPNKCTETILPYYFCIDEGLVFGIIAFAMLLNQREMKIISIRILTCTPIHFLRAQKWCTLMDPHIWPGKSRTTSSNIRTAAKWGYGM